MISSRRFLHLSLIHIFYKEQLGVLAVVSNLFGNVIGFVPFGLILPIICRNARGFFFITFSGFALSLCVETIQPVSYTHLYYGI